MMKIKTTFSREGVIFLFVTIVFMIGSIVREVNPMLLLAAALFAILPTSGWVGRYSLRGVSVRRKLPERVFAGDPFIVHIGLSKYCDNNCYNKSDVNLESVSESGQSGQLNSKNTPNGGGINLPNNAKKTKQRKRRNAGSWGVVVSDRIQSIHDESVEGENPSEMVFYNKADLKLNAESQQLESVVQGQNLSSVSEMVYEPAVYFEYIGQHSVIQKSYAGKLPQRGKYKFGPMTISTRFPFGFFRHSMCLSDGLNGDEFYVFPKVGHLSSRWQTRRTEAAINRQRYRFRPSRGTGEFLGVRQWLPGDTIKWIHWRASARHGQPFVRQFEIKQNYDCAVLLDLYDEQLESNQVESGNFELALSFAATLVCDMTRRGGCNLFFATSKPDEESLSGPICLPLVESVLRRLATARHEIKDNLPRAILEALLQIDPGADIILISPKPINLINSQRFNAIRNDARFRTAIQRIKCVDTSNTEFNQYFSLQ
ncbi:MAG: DUF58 domain-containing protein [Planctomycetaceae bacterium]|jgi:uncharacterized protein (DUF58 family)|nr:DUF58 domain-containing protein [Planctomycetaceae bacterium]